MHCARCFSRMAKLMGKRGALRPLATKRCRHCKKQRDKHRYGGRTSQCCVACAAVHDAAWYAARVAVTRCIHCEQGRNHNRYGGKATDCCITCAAVHDEAWHAAYVAATRCSHCERKRTAVKYGEKSTDCCRTCAEVHDLAWHAAYVAATRCSHCEKGRANNRYGGMSTDCCIACAAVHDSAWHAAYVAATRCSHCEHQRAARIYGGRMTDCCISCAEVHDAAWHAARVNATRCQHQGSRPCKNFGIGARQLCILHGGGLRCSRADAHHLEEVPPPAYYKADGGAFCWGCFAANFPERAKLKVKKEHYLVAELQRRLADVVEDAQLLEWDCRVPGGCSMKKPDLLIVWPRRYLHFEIDEHGHAGNECYEEDARLEIIAADVDRPGLVVRLNPDIPGYECFRPRQLNNGEFALEAVGRNFELLAQRVEAAARRLLPTAASGVQRVFVDSHPDRNDPVAERLW